MNNHNTNFPPNINPQEYSLLAVGIAAAIVSDFNANEQNSIGNWLMLVAQYILTHAAQQQLIESRIENANININSKKHKSGNGGPFTDNEVGKSNQTQRSEVEFLLEAVDKIMQELEKINGDSELKNESDNAFK